MRQINPNFKSDQDSNCRPLDPHASLSLLPNEPVITLVHISWRHVSKVDTICPCIIQGEYKAHVSQLLVYRHPPASLFYTLLHPHQNFKIAKIFHYFQNIIVFTSFGTFKHQFYFSKHKTENYRCKNRGFDCRPTFHAFRTNRSFSWKLFCCKY